MHGFVVLGACMEPTMSPLPSPFTDIPLGSLLMATCTLRHLWLHLDRGDVVTLHDILRHDDGSVSRVKVLSVGQPIWLDVRDAERYLIWIRIPRSTDVPPQADIDRLRAVAALVSKGLSDLEKAAALLLEGATSGAPEASDLYWGAWQALTRYKDSAPLAQDIAPTTEWTGGDTKIAGRGCVDRWPRGWGLPTDPNPR